MEGGVVRELPPDPMGRIVGGAWVIDFCVLLEELGLFGTLLEVGGLTGLLGLLLGGGGMVGLPWVLL